MKQYHNKAIDGDAENPDPTDSALQVKGAFPILGRSINDAPLAYLDNAATTQKPQCVIDAMTRYYAAENANVHRGVHYLSSLATERYETARENISRFFGATEEAGYCTVFTSGATQGINLVAHGLKHDMQCGDEVLITQMEHHSNLVPWQLLCEATGAKLRVVPMNENGALCMEEFERLLNTRTKIVAATHVSNVLGTVNPVREICAMAKAQGAVSVIDGAQSAPHVPVNLATLGADFFGFSGHKLYGPTGIGVLFGRMEQFERMPPYQSGGNTIRTVTLEKTTFAPPPERFEAGTPHIAGVVGLDAAVAFLQSLGLSRIAAHEKALLNYATKALESIPGVRLIGDPPDTAAIRSFAMAGVHPHDIAQVLDNAGVAIRSGHHCAQPVMAFYQVPATARVSFGVYNTKEDVDAFATALHTVREMFS